jgi:DNA polymerase-2
MSNFIFNLNKKEKDNENIIKLYYFDEKKETKQIILDYPYKILINEENFKELNLKSEKIKISNKKYLNFNKEKVIELNIESKELFKYILDEVRHREYKIYEADLSTELKTIIDYEIPIFVKDFDEKAKKFLKEENKKPKTPKVLSIDIETIGNKENQEIIMISVLSNEEKIKKVYLDGEKITEKTRKETNLNKFGSESIEFKLEILDNEKELLETFKKELFEYSPQIIIGWNVIDFDFKVIKERFQKYNIEFKLNKFDEENCSLRIFGDFFKDSTLNCEGILIFDAIQLLKSNYISFEDYKLNTVAKEVLKDEKIDIEFSEEADFSIENKIKAIEETFKKDPIKLIEYNFKDSYLTLKICEKLNLIELMLYRSYITGTPLSKVKSPIATLDVMYLKELHKRGYVANSNFNFNSTSPIMGAYVAEPKRGFYDDVFVFDFKSLYPSIIMTFNIDPLTYDKNGEIEAPNGAKFNRKQGILPKIIERLYIERNIAKKEKDYVKSHALKITMNSFYGAIASPKSRYYNKDIGGAITSFGREIIQLCAKEVEKKGYNAIYGDTDSCFVQIPNIKDKTVEEKIKIGKKIEKELNEFFKEWVKKNFGVKNYLVIEFEKLYSKFFISTKKRYVGLNEFSKNIEFTGLEAVRGDWTELSKKFQKEIVKLIFSGHSKKEIEKFILGEIKKLESGKYDKDLIYRKKITKPLSEYTKTTPPHVKAARELNNFNGKIVEYVITKEGPKHISLINENTKYDYDHYIEKQLKAVADDFLEILKIDFEKLVNSRKQKSLDKFFN